MLELDTAAVQSKYRPFPWHCPRCRRKEVRPAAIHYQCERTHDGRKHTIDIPELETPKCGHCGELVLTYAQDDVIRRALRRQLGLLQADEIEAGRAALALTQEGLAARLGVTEEQVSHWETYRQNQSRALDNLMRVFFGSSEAR